MRNEGYNEFWDEKKIAHLPIVLTPAEAMEVLGVGKNTIYRLLNSGELPAVRIGRSWRIAGHEIEQFMAFTY